MSRAVSTRRGLPGAAVPAPKDRRFRRPDVRPERRRLMRVTWRIVRWGGPGLVAIGLALWLGRVLVASEWLRVQHIVVRGNVRLSVDDVEMLVKGLRSEYIVRVPLDGYQLRLVDSPWIERATLARVLPATIDVEIVERTPMAIARLGRQLYVVDVTGVIIGEYGLEHRDIDLPIVDGLMQPPGRPAAAAHEDRVRLTAALLGALASRPDLSRRVSQIDVSNAHDAVLMLDDDPAWLHLGREQFVDRVATYLDLAPTLHERFEDLDSVDLRFGERVFVRGRSVDTADLLKGQK